MFIDIIFVITFSSCPGLAFNLEFPWQYLHNEYLRRNEMCMYIEVHVYLHVVSLFRSNALLYSSFHPVEYIYLYNYDHFKV